MHYQTFRSFEIFLTQTCKGIPHTKIRPTLIDLGDSYLIDCGKLPTRLSKNSCSTRIFPLLYRVLRTSILGGITNLQLYKLPGHIPSLIVYVM